MKQASSKCIENTRAGRVL